jgi:tRNA-specific 2-thiouridylase
MVDENGAEIGRHEGIIGFTVGQRRGLGVASGEPRYVVKIEPATATVVLGRRQDLSVAGVRLQDVIWSGGEPLSGGIEAQYRAHGEPVEAAIQGDRLVFNSAQEGVAPGQTVAFYDGDQVLGGALIAETFV